MFLFYCYNLNLFILIIFGLFLLLISSDNSWGFQTSGTIYKIDNDYEGYLYAAGTQEIYPHDYFISKINPNGELSWSTRPIPLDQTGKVVIANSIAFQNRSVFVAGFSGKLGYIFVSSLNKFNGKLEWETRDITASNTHLLTTTLIANDEALYLLGFSGLPHITPSNIEPYLSTNDFIMKINPINGSIIWSKMLSISSDHDLSLHPFNSVFNYLSFYPQDPSLLYVSGHYHDFSTGGSFKVIELIHTSNGTLYKDISNMPADRHVISYTKSTYKQNTYTAMSAENVHYYGTDQSILGSLIIKNTCPDGYHFVAQSETTSIEKKCPGISWSVQYYEDHSLTCSYIFAGVYSTGLTFIYLVPVIFLLFVVYFSHISILSTIVSTFATISFAADVSYLTSHVFYGHIIFSLLITCFFFPMIPYIAYLRTRIKGRTLKNYLSGTVLTNSTSTFFKILSIFINTIIFIIIYTIGYILYLFSLLPHPPVIQLLLSFLCDNNNNQNNNTNNNNNNIIEDENDENDRSLFLSSSKSLSSSSLFTSLSLILFSFTPTLILQSLNNKIMDLIGILSIISIISKSLFILSLINHMFYAYGSSTVIVLWSHLQTLISTSLSSSLSVFSVLQFEEFDEENNNNGNNNGNNNNQNNNNNEVEMLKKRIKELESQLNKESNRNNNNNMINREINEEKREGEEIYSSY